jgi:uncharacterized membrane protein YfcA
MRLKVKGTATAALVTGLGLLYFMFVYNVFGVFPSRNKGLPIGRREPHAIVREEDPERFRTAIALGVGIGISSTAIGIGWAISKKRPS